MATLLPAEQLRMALEMECRGYALYSRARALTNDPALRALLDDLCREEALHYEMFSAMAEGRPQAAGEQNQLAIAMAAEAFYPGGKAARGPVCPGPGDQGRQNREKAQVFG